MSRERKPIEQQIAEGDPAKRGKNKLQELKKLVVQPTKGLPACPSRLTGVAAETWELLSSELQVIDKASRPDAPALEGACRMHARAVELDLVIDQYAISQENIFSMSRLMSRSAEAWDKYLKFASQFGLTPVSRTKLTIEKKDDVDEEVEAQLRTPDPDIGAIQ